MITQAHLRIEFDYDPATGLLTRAGTGVVAGYVNKSRGYRLIEVYGKTYQAHRLVWLYVHGEWPKHTIDHINRDRTDNRIANLRDIPQGENNRNTGLRADNTSGVKGVYWHKPSGLWLVLAFRHGVQKSLGYYKDVFEAACARKSWDARNPIGA